MRCPLVVVAATHRTCSPKARRPRPPCAHAFPACAIARLMAATYARADATMMSVEVPVPVWVISEEIPPSPPLPRVGALLSPEPGCTDADGSANSPVLM